MNKRSKCKKRMLSVLAACCIACCCAVMLSSCASSGSSAGASNTSSGVSSDEASQSADAVHYVAVIGSDYWTSSKTAEHLQGSDLMMLMRVDTQNATISLLTIPRDTYYVQKDENGQEYYPGETCSNCSGKTWVKANYAFHYGYYQAKEQGESYREAVNAGARKACEAISEITTVPVTDYITCDLMTFQTIIDTIGGVSVTLPYDIDYTFYDNSYSAVHLDAGEQTLDGFNAMVASRSRVSYRTKYSLEEDATRQGVCRAMMASLIEKALNADTCGFASTELMLNTLVSCGLVETNISSEAIASWASDLQENKDKLTIYGASGPYEVERYHLPEFGEDGEADLQTLVPYDEEAYRSIAAQFCEGVEMTQAFNSAVLLG